MLTADCTVCFPNKTLIICRENAFFAPHSLLFQNAPHNFKVVILALGFKTLVEIPLPLLTT